MRQKNAVVRWLAFCLLLCAGTAAAGNLGALLWEARSGAGTVYLFGTVHVGRADFYPLAANVEKAFRASSALALEVDFSEEKSNAASMQIGMLPRGRTLEQELSADMAGQLRRILAAGDLPMEGFRPLKPFMAMLALVSMEYAKLGYFPEFGLDQYFARRARLEEKAVIGLESGEGQLRMMDGLSRPLQQAMLKLTLDDIEAGKVAPVAERLISSWRRGDAQAVQDLLISESRRLPAPAELEFREKFLTARNRVMLAGVEKALEANDTLFVAVGALHLIGPDSLTALMEKKGFSLKRL